MRKSILCVGKLAAVMSSAAIVIKGEYVIRVHIYGLTSVLIGVEGFEPPASRSQTERTTRLCYAPKSFNIRSLKLSAILAMA